MVIRRYMSVSPALALIPDRCILVRKNLQVSGNFSFERGALVRKSNQGRVQKKRTFIWLSKWREWPTRHPPPMWHWIWTILSSCFHHYFSFLKKRESPKAASSRTTDGTPQPKAAEQVNQNDHPPRCRLLPSKLDHLYNLTQLYPDPDIFSR